MLNSPANEAGVFLANTASTSTHKLKLPRPKFLPHKDAPNRWRVEIPKSFSGERPKRRRRHFFPTQEAAEKFITAFKSQLREIGTSARLLRPLDTLDADQAIRMLRRFAIKHQIKRPSLRTLADEWMDRWNDSNRSVKLSRLFDLYLESRSGDSLKHLQSLQYTKTRFQKFHPQKVNLLTKQQIETALRKLPATSFNAHLRRIRSILRFGQKHGFLGSNPALLVNLIKRPRKEVQILTVPTVELMLRTAQQYQPKLLSFLCISLFAGTRTAETFKLLWKDFNLTDKKPRVRAEVSKTNQSRPVDLSDNFCAWLETFQRHPERRVMSGFTADTLKNRRNELWQAMLQSDPTLPRIAPNNCLRHCFVSYYLLAHGSIDDLLMQSGHTSKVMFQHYLSIVRKTDAATYWNLRP